MLEVSCTYLFTQERIPMRIKPPTLGEKIAMAMVSDSVSNDSAPIVDPTTIVDRLEEHSDSSHKAIHDPLPE